MQGKQLVSIKGPCGTTALTRGQWPNRTKGGNYTDKPTHRGNATQKNRANMSVPKGPAQKTKRRRKREPNSLPGLQGHRDIEPEGPKDHQ